MERFYVEYTPVQRGLTGKLYLAQYLDEHFSNVKFTGLFTNGLIEFGYIESNHEDISNVMDLCSKGFNVKRLFIEEFRGAGRLFWNEPIDHETGEPTGYTITNLFSDHDIENNVSYLDDVRSYKTKLLKVLTKNKFGDYNDLVANLTKQMLLLQEYKDGLDVDQLVRYDNIITAIKSIYSAETCLTAMEEDMAIAGSIMPGYYEKKAELYNATTLDAIKSISLI